MRAPGHTKRNPAQRRRHFLREWREFRGLSQEDLGDRIGVAGATVSRIENLKNGYNQDTLEPIGDALGVHPGVILSRAPSPSIDGEPAQAKPGRKGGRKR